VSEPLRPTSLEAFAGQPQLAADLRVLLGAAAARDQCADHVLLAGPPGLGKTTLAQIIAHELTLPFASTSAPALEKPGDLLAVLSGIQRPSVVFVDEIHALDRRAEELLYTAMEDGHVDMVVGDGPTARTVRLPLQPFTLVGATTQLGQLTGPLRDRFGFFGRLTPYADEDLAQIVLRSASMLDLDLDPAAAATIAGRSRGTPRVANRWLRRVRDYAQVNELGTISADIAAEALDSFGIDRLGLDPLGRDILQSVAAQFDGGPVGLSTLAAAVGEAETTIAEVYEPHLMREGLLKRTPRGRVVTAGGWRHLGVDPPDGHDPADGAPQLPLT